MLSEEILSHAEKIRTYMKMNHDIKKSEVIFVLGSHDMSVARYAVDLIHQWYGDYLLVSWKSNISHEWQWVMEKKMREELGVIWNEAHQMKQIALDKWVPEEKILVEDQATNTELNIKYWYKVLKKQWLQNSSILFVHKPYMERRTYATLMKQRPWDNSSIKVVSEPISFLEYRKWPIDDEVLINFLVWDLDRIIKYPYAPYEYQIAQEVSDEVLISFEFLKSKGFTKRIIS